MKSLLHKTGRILFYLLFSGCVLLAASPAFTSDVSIDEVLDAIEKKYAGKSFEADFRQISKLAALDITEIASGSAAFRHPGKMRWRYAQPERHEIITNGTSLWIFRPEENQLMKGNASAFFTAGAGGAFLSDISLVRTHYVARFKTVTPGYTDIELIAKKKTPDIALIEIRVSQKTSEITQVVTHNIYDDTTLFEFSNIRFNEIEPGVFEFHPPEGISIIDMDE